MSIESAMTPRLLAIANSVKTGSVIADVGTDHGYIPIYLSLKNKISGALAMDLRPGPLHRAEENIVKYHLEETVKTRLSNGLTELLPGEADTAVIAGMGGLLIAEILEAKPFPLSCYVLQPMTATAELRQYLAENGYKICNEVLAKEDEKLYTVMTVCHGTMEISDPVYHQVGKPLMENRDPLTPALIDQLLEKYTAAKTGLLRSNRDETKEKIQKFTDLITSLEKLKKECQTW